MGKKLAIRGHSTRGKEVIELLEMMGGHADDLLDNGIDEKYAYFIVNDENNVIDAFPIYKKDEFDFDVQIFTLEEFLEKYPYKVGDTVTVWVEDWENRRGSYVSVKIECVKWDDCRCKIIYVTKVGGMYIFFEAKDVKENMEDNDNPLKDNDNPTSVEETQSKRDIDKAEFMIKHMILPNKMDDKLEYEIIDGYEFDKVENGKIILKPIKPKYPTTYAECKEMLGENVYYGFSVFMTLQNLIICRDAYWKIAGEQMGLDKPWAPDWTSGKPFYCISVSGNTIGKGKWYTDNKILAFPTEEMRDTFYENFKDLIESCKELL